MIKSVFSLMGVMAVVGLVSCGKNKSSNVEGTAGSAPMALMTLTMDGPPESIAIEGDHVFISSIGKEMKPTEKDGDGVILETNNKGDIVAENAFPGVKLDAPKGMAVLDNVLYVADVDRIVGLDLKSRKMVSLIDLSRERMRFLNDLAATADGKLVVSSTDTNQIFIVNPKEGTYVPLATSVAVAGPNGLALSSDGTTLYVAGYSKDDNGTGDGQLWSVNLSTGAAVPLCGEKGRFDGLALEGDFLYFSDWDKDGQAGAIRMLNLKTKEITDITRIPLKGVADFLIDRQTETIWIPAMLEKKVIHSALVLPKEQ